MDIYDCYAADEEQVLEQKAKFRVPFEQALKLFIEGKFPEAQKQFGMILSQWDGDRASMRLFERSAELAQRKDLSDWDGVDRVISK